MIIKDYPYWTPENLDHVIEQIQQISRTRKDDISIFSNLENVFMSGRKVGKIPTASNDVTDEDRIGDFNFDAGYLYILVDNSGATWRRATLGSW